MASKVSNPIALLSSLMLASVAQLGCGDDARSCVASVCDPATFTPACVGNAVQSCGADGKRFLYTACSAQQRCDAASGACVARACTTLGRSTCASLTEAERCKDDGSASERIPCGASETCRDGACVPRECASSDSDHCTTNGFVTCTNAAWVQENCPVGDLCTLAESGVARCIPAACTPEARRCDGKTVRICDARGASEAVVNCAGAEICVDGACQPEVCGGASPGDVSEVSDASEVGDGQPEPDSEIVFTLNGVANTFDISAFAVFDSGDRQVTVKASKSTRALELRFNPANMTVQGTFSSEIFNPVKVRVCYDDGGNAASFDDCAGFTHRSVAYDVVVTRNDGTGGRFEASFSATLEDKNTDTIVLSAGQINVKYR